VINVLIYMSCVAIALDSIETVRAEFQTELATFEWFSVVFFTLDYLFNIYTAKSRLAYMTSFWGMVDLLSILPSYLMLLNFSSIRATKILRLLRVIRILRVLKLARSAMKDVNAARDGKTNRIAANLRIYFIALFSVLMISSTLMFYVEGSLYTPEAIAEGQIHIDAAVARGEAVANAKFIPSDPLTGAAIPEEKRFFTSIPETMWWCIVTLTTTGYGDLYPVTMGGRIIAGVTMLLGLVLFGMLMNIVGKTLMVMLFGEPVGHETEEKLKTPEEKIGAAFDLLADAGVISHKSAYMLRDIPRYELSERLEGSRMTA
jgi:voltage-gated potassium channel